MKAHHRTRRMVLRITGLVVGLVLVSVYGVQAQHTLWEAYLDAGNKAREAGRYAEAEKQFKLALAEAESFGPWHVRLATSLNNLAAVYDDQGKYDAAEPLYKRALAISEKSLGPDHPDVATSLNNLADLYRTQGKYDAAEPLHKRALAIREKALGTDHPDVAQSLNNLAELYRTQARDAKSIIAAHNLHC